MKEDVSLQTLCKELRKEELVKLVMYLDEHHADIDIAVMEWYRSHKGLDKKQQLPNKLLWEYWERAEKIINSFNEYGGGPEHLEDEAYDYLQKINELVFQSSVPAEEKRSLINRIFRQYDLGNSGFEDALMDAMYELCSSESDWKHLIKLLQKESSSWHEKLIIGIYKDKLQNSEEYMNLRLQSLEYGMDYWDLVQYYLSQKDISKAVETAEKGLQNGKGRVTELLLFLFDSYAKQNDISKIQALIETALQKKSDIAVVRERAFEYFKRNGDYEHAKDILLKAFRMTYHGKRHYKDFLSVKNYLSSDDWAQVRHEFMKIVQTENTVDYLNICYNEEMYDEMLEILLAPQRNIHVSLDSIADKLVFKYPREIIEYYWNEGCMLIPNGDRKRYKEAAKYFKKARDIYQKNLKEYNAWQSRIERLKMQHKNKRAFLDEMKVLEEA